MSDAGSKDIKSLLTLVLGWAQVGQQIYSIMSDTEYSNTWQFSHENFEATVLQVLQNVIPGPLTLGSFYQTLCKRVW